MRKLRIASLKSTLWQRRGKRNELEKFIEETERKSREERWKMREEMWRKQEGVTDRTPESKRLRRGIENMSKLKEEKERLEREKRLIRKEREKYVGKESDDEEWEKLEVYIGRIEKCLEDEMWDEIYKPEEGEDAEKLKGRGKKRSREEEDDSLIREMKRLRLEEDSEKKETGATEHAMGAKTNIETEKARNHPPEKGQTQNHQSPKNKRPVTVERSENDIREDRELENLPNRSINLAEKEGNQTKTPKKGIAEMEGNVKTEGKGTPKTKRKEKVYTPSVRKYFKKVKNHHRIQST